MRLTAIIFIFLTFQSCNGQNPPKELRIPEVGWTLFIPPDSKFLSSAQFDTIKIKAVNAINDTYGLNEALNEVHPLFTISDKQFNIFGSTINLYDSSMFKTWQESYQASKAMIIDLLNQQGDQVKVKDTASSSEQIDGLSFQKFYLETIYPKQTLTMHTYWYYRKHGRYDFSINVSFTDETVGKQYLDIIKKSKFDR